MSSHEEAGGSGHPEQDPVEAANHYFEYLDKHRLRVQGGTGTNPDTNTGTDITPETGNDAGEASKGPKPKRA